MASNVACSLAETAYDASLINQKPDRERLSLKGLCWPLFGANPTSCVSRPTVHVQTSAVAPQHDPASGARSAHAARARHASAMQRDYTVAVAGSVVRPLPLPCLA